MALLFADSFDHYGTGATGRLNMLLGAYAEISHGNAGPSTPDATQARTGSNSLKMPYNSGSTGSLIVRRIIGGADRFVIGTGLGLYFTSLPTNNDVIGLGLYSGSNTLVAFLFIQSDGSIAIKSGGVIVATSDPCLSAGAWNHVEWKSIIDTIVGSFEVRVNGISVLNETDLNTGSTGVAAIRWGTENSNSGSNTWYQDDVIIWDDSGDVNNDFMGLQRVQTLFVDSDEVAADWVITGAATGHEAIDEAIQDGDTTYISSDIVGEVSEFGLPALPPETELITGVYIPALAKIEEAGVGSIKVSMISGATESAGPDTALTTAYTYWGGVHEVDPATGLPWTKAGVEAALVRVKKTA